ncbi:MAG: fibronectin type III domain-containing protein [Opitutaceae bacterium]|nr:fibronectin type III domain-containing protein [Opitutaceae bacterium]
MAQDLNCFPAALQLHRSSVLPFPALRTWIQMGLLFGCVFGHELAGATVALSWTDNSNNEDGFVIQRRTLLGAYSDVATVRDNRVQFLDSGVDAGATYLYRVAAFNEYGRSLFTRAISTTVQSMTSQVGQPVISPIADRAVAPGQAIGVLSLSLSHANGDAGSLKVVATSSNQALIPNDGLLVGGSGASRTLAINPVPNQTGSTVVTVVVSNDWTSTSSSFVVTVGSGSVPELNQSQQMYFGSIGSGATRGWFALVAKTDRTGWLLADGPEFPSGCVQTPVTFGASGEFSLEITGVGVVRGVVSRGNLAGVVGPAGIPMIGTLEGTSGPWAAAQGLYWGAVAGTYDDKALTCVGSSGRTIVAVTHRGFLRSFEVNLTAQEFITVGTPDDVEFRFRLRPVQGLVEGTLTSTRGVQTWAARMEGRPTVERIMNVSVRGVLETSSDVLVAGFTVGGNGSRPLIVRAVGPTLGQFGVLEALQDPRLEVFRQGTGELPFAVNDSWNEQLLPAAFTYGAFPLVAGSADAAIAATLPSGSYTARVGAAAGEKGQVLVELYDADTTESFASARLANISLLTRVKDADARIIGGFSVVGDVPRRLLVRAVGPELAAFGVVGTLQDPVLELYSSDGSRLAVADNSPPATGLFSELVSRTGAFALNAVTKSSAHLVWLAPGVYTAHVKSGDGSPGVVLLEIYEVP